MDVRAEMVANVWKILAETGQVVASGEEIVILESMKMEIPVESPVAGTVRLAVDEGQVVQEGDLLAEVE